MEVDILLIEYMGKYTPKQDDHYRFIEKHKLVNETTCSKLLACSSLSLMGTTAIRSLFTLRTAPSLKSHEAYDEECSFSSIFLSSHLSDDQLALTNNDVSRLPTSTPGCDA